jgi:cation/acetate symporter
VLFRSLREFKEVRRGWLGVRIQQVDDQIAESLNIKPARGAVIGGFLGLVTSVGLTIVSPSVWEVTLGNPKGSAWFPYTSPALFSMTIGFVGIWLFSILDRSAQATKEREAFEAQQVRSETGLGAAGASGH